VTTRNTENTTATTNAATGNTSAATKPARSANAATKPARSANTATKTTGSNTTTNTAATKKNTTTTTTITKEGATALNSPAPNAGEVTIIPSVDHGRGQISLHSFSFLKLMLDIALNNFSDDQLAHIGSDDEGKAEYIF
jgi:hypothetical protein